MIKSNVTGKLRAFYFQESLGKLNIKSYPGCISYRFNEELSFTARNKVVVRTPLSPRFPGLSPWAVPFKGWRLRREDILTNDDLIP